MRLQQVNEGGGFEDRAFGDVQEIGQAWREGCRRGKEERETVRAEGGAGGGTRVRERKTGVKEKCEGRRTGGIQAIKG